MSSHIKTAFVAVNNCCRNNCNHICHEQVLSLVADVLVAEDLVHGPRKLVFNMGL